MYKQNRQNWLFSVTYPASYQDVIIQHLPLALISGVILLAANYLPFEKIHLFKCFFLRLTGYPCPTCGWTRGFISMAHGAFSAVLYDCPLAIGLYIITAIVFACNAVGLMLGLKIGGGYTIKLNKKRISALIGLCFVLILLNWFYRLAIGVT